MIPSVTRRLGPLLLAAVCAIVAGGGIVSSASAGAEGGETTIPVDPFVWHLDRDYPGAQEFDSDLPISRVLLKTHDTTDWMSTYDEHPLAVSGPEALALLIDLYEAQDIEVAAWFVPKGRDVETQLEMANEVLDAGVTALYADVEAFAGFCTPDCGFLAEAFWSELRAQRPEATLGVIYDPRDPWVDFSFAADWLANADVAVPMCYWESYSGQGAWGDPTGCVYQAYYRLQEMMDGQAIDYEPALQGNSTPERFVEAMEAAIDLGSERATVWRRGVVSQETWDAIESHSGILDPPCWLDVQNGCLLTEIEIAEAYVVEGGAAFAIPDEDVLEEMGYAPDDVDLAPDGFIASLPTIPEDDTLLAEHATTGIYVVYGGARVRVFDNPPVTTALLLDRRQLRIVPPGALEEIPTVPKDYSRFREESSDDEYVIIAGGKVVLSEEQVAALNSIGQAERLYVVPDGALDDLPVNQIVHGDVSCSGTLDVVDGLMLLKTVAGLPNPGVCSVTDNDCSGSATALDVLRVLRHVAGLPVAAIAGCPALGS